MSESKKAILAALGGIPEEVYDAIVASFYEEAKDRIKQIQQALDSGDLSIVARCAHAVKGSSGNLRLASIQETAKALEFASKNGDMPSTILFFDQLRKAIP